MPATPDDLFAFLDRLGIAHQTVTHPPLFTVEESQALRGQIPGGHTKNLFLKDKKGTLFLVVALEDALIDLKSLHRRLGATGRFSFGSADLMHQTLGVVPGSVTPFGLINDTGVQVTVVDRQPFQGPITISSDGRTHVIGYELAQVVRCAVEERA